MKKIIVLVLALMMLAFSACSQETEESVPTYNESGVSQSDIGDEEPPAAEPIFAETRQEAYSLVMSGIIEKNVFPDGSSAECFRGEMEDNKFAVCDVDGDGGEELIIIFTTTDVAGMHGRVYDYDEETGTVVEEWGTSYNVRFLDNGYAITENYHNQTHGELWPYYLYSYLPETDSYEAIAWVHSRNRDLSEEIGFDYPYDADTSDYGEVYYIDEDLSDSSAYEEETPVDITEYEAWLDSKIGDAKEINVEYFPITQENITNQLG